MNQLINRAKFYSGVRNGPFPGKLSVKQVQGMETIWDALEAQSAITDFCQIAYIFATVFWETDRTMQPIAEYGKGKGKRYGVPAGPFGKIYYGRGFVQLTWLANYQKATEHFEIDYVRNPDWVMRPEDAAQIMLWGMRTGAFTGKKLSDYFNSQKCDWLEARRIINAKDKASQIALIAKQFYADMVLAI